MNVFSVGLFIILSVTTNVIAQVSTGEGLFLSPLIKQKRFQEARNLSTVDSSYFLNFTSHSGFLTVDENYNSNIFFWYFPVMNKPVNETPWIIWLQGGPGGSSLYGLFDELGPFEYVDNKLKSRKYSWGENYSLLFIDNPIGAGFSFTNSRDGFVRDMEACSNHLFSTIQQFLTIFPELRKAPLYVAGESYAGRYIPALGLKILESDVRPGTESEINLLGLIMGNPIINRESIADYTSVFYSWGLIDSQGVLAVKPLQDEYLAAIRRKDNSDAFDLRDKLLTKLENLAFQQQEYNILKDKLDLKGFVNYITMKEIRNALHVGNIRFSLSNSTVHYQLIPDFLSNVKPKVEKLLEHYKVLIYCGQLDLISSCVLNAEARRKQWHWSLRDEFLNAPRIPWWYNESVAGYVKSGGRLTEVLVRGAGHLVPIDKPVQAQQLISYFITGLDFPKPLNYEILPEDTPKYKELRESPNIAFNVSIVINVMLVLVIFLGIIYYLRWKKRNEAYFYSTAEDSISDGILTMA